MGLNLDDKKAIIAEVQQAGIFQIEGFNANFLEPKAARFALSARADVDPNDGPNDDDVLSLDGSRRIEIGVVGSAWAARWPRLTGELEVFRC